jgi:dipeptidyl aminopeptidase/acylaminoacyl peptidase
MKHRSIKLIAFLTAAFTVANSASALNVEDLVQLRRMSDPRISPDAQSVLYALRETDLAANKGVNSLWTVPFAGGEPRRLTAKGQSVAAGRYSPDGRYVYFLSARSGSNQLWRLSLSGGEAEQVSDLPLDVSNYSIAPNGKSIAFALEIFQTCEPTNFACSRDAAKATEAPTPSGVSHDKLFIRHWDSWQLGARSQLFVAAIVDGKLGAPEHVSVDANGKALDGDAPSKPDGDDSEYAFAPDSQSIAFSLRVAGRSEAWSTNLDVYHYVLGSKKSKNLTADNLATDTSPVFAAKGDKLYYKAFSRPTFEADRYRIMELSLASGKTREVAPGWDRSPDSLALSSDGKTIYTTANHLGQRPAFAIAIADGAVTQLTNAGSVGGLAINGNKLALLKDDLRNPADLYTGVGKSLKAITASNADKLKTLRFGDAEQFTFKGWNDETVYAWLVKPVDFDPSKRYPIAYLIHGGPQGSFGNQFHYRWNPQTYAGQGFAAIMVDFHGSTGYGQAFTDSISGDWGGKPLEDLQKGLAAATAKYSFLDGDRACALGGSYGGYMTNWIAGAWPERFKCLVTHAGIFDTRFMAYSTEELWFSEWENGGVAWDRAEAIERHNPISKVKEWRTPMLVIHGQKDFRVPFEQGIAAFTALQRKGIDSQFLWYGEENHWILKPKNSIQWHNAVNAWLHRHLDSK